MPRRVIRAGDRVTMFEIFFDLVFVFALMRVIALVEADPGPSSLGRGLLLLLLLWWAWCAFIWLGNRVRLDRGPVAGASLLAMAALFVAAVVIPSAWDAPADGLAPSVVLAVAVVVVRASYLGTFLGSSREDTRLRTQILIDAVPQSVSAVLLVTGAIVGGDGQTVLWAIAFAVDFGVGWLASRYNGWRVGSPRHFAERHELVLIIALGETVLSAGVGPAAGETTWLALAAALIGFLVVVALWWSYFRGPAAAARAAMAAAPVPRRPAIARDAYTLGHLPLVLGVIVVAVGLRLLLEALVHAPAEPVGRTAVLAVFGGLATYFGGLGVFARVATGRGRRLPFVAAAVLLGAAWPTASLPAPALLALTALIALAAAIAIAAEERRHHAVMRGGASPADGMLGACGWMSRARSSRPRHG
ncbi:low temperature requirement protein A [Agromyces sp. G08B096]|uniref:Low temperature requirement protein A n=1 Tax=Agromyces sp. G08B096 TaxID=3156399 RepID=A0AAU7WAD7_9MICO